MEEKDKSNKNNDEKNKNYQNFIIIAIVVLVAMLVINMMLDRVRDSRQEEISYDTFIQWLDEDKIDEVLITSDRLEITLAEDSENGFPMTYYTGIAEESDALSQRLEDSGVSFKRQVVQSGSMIWTVFLYYILPSALI